MVRHCNDASGNAADLNRYNDRWCYDYDLCDGHGYIECARLLGWGTRKYDGNQGVWYCAGRTIRSLIRLESLAIDGSQVNLGAGSEVDGSAIVTADSYASYLPSDLADGDADTQLDQAGVLDMYKDRFSILCRFRGGWFSHCDGRFYTSYLPSDLADGDADTKLDQAGVLGYVDGSQVNLGGFRGGWFSHCDADSYTSYLPSDLADGMSIPSSLIQKLST